MALFAMTVSGSAQSVTEFVNRQMDEYPTVPFA